MFALKCVSPGVFLPVVVSPCQVCVVDLLFLWCADKGAGLAGLLGEAVVDVRDNSEVGALWIAKAYIDPVISWGKEEKEENKEKIYSILKVKLEKL